MQTNQSTPRGALITIIVGILILAGGIAVPVISSSKHSDWAEVNATVANVECKIAYSSNPQVEATKECQIVLNYAYNGQSYSTATAYHDDGLRAGDTHVIKVNPNAPSEIAISAPKVPLCVFLILLGLIVMGCGAYSFKNSVKRRKDRYSSVLY